MHRFNWAAAKRRITSKLIAVVSCILMSSACTYAYSQASSDKRIGFTIIAEYAHRPTAFTQGLLVLNEGSNNGYKTKLIEGTGQKGQSSLSRLALSKDIMVEQEVKLSDNLFGEGVTQFGNSLYQLAWQAGKCLDYDAQTLALRETKHYEGQGWGLTANAEQLIMSDGTARLQFRDPQSFVLTNTLVVNDRGRPVKAINELEWARGLIYANIWYSNWIIAIDPKSGRVRYKVDLSSLKQQQSASADVLNGIAYRPSTDTFFVTGKYWNKIYEIRLVDQASQG